MNTLYLVLAVLLLLTTIASLVRMWRAPTAAERRRACRLLGTCGVAMMLLLAQALPTSGLSFSLLAVVTVVAFTLLTWSDPVGSGQLDSEQALIESREAERLLCCRRHHR